MVNAKLWRLPPLKLRSMNLPEWRSELQLKPNRQKMQAPSPPFWTRREACSYWSSDKLMLRRDEGHCDNESSNTDSWRLPQHRALLKSHWVKVSSGTDSWRLPQHRALLTSHWVKVSSDTDGWRLPQHRALLKSHWVKVSSDTNSWRLPQHRALLKSHWVKVSSDTDSWRLPQHRALLKSHWVVRYGQLTISTAQSSSEKVQKCWHCKAYVKDRVRGVHIIKTAARKPFSVRWCYYSALCWLICLSEHGLLGV